MDSNQLYHKGRRGEWLLCGLLQSHRYFINFWGPVRGGGGRASVGCVSISSWSPCHFCSVKLCYGLGAELIGAVCHHGRLYPLAFQSPLLYFH